MLLYTDVCAYVSLAVVGWRRSLVSEQTKLWVPSWSSWRSSLPSAPRCQLSCSKWWERCRNSSFYWFTFELWIRVSWPFNVKSTENQLSFFFHIINDFNISVSFLQLVSAHLILHKEPLSHPLLYPGSRFVPPDWCQFPQGSAGIFSGCFHQ